MIDKAVVDKVLAVLRKHEPLISFGYEEVNCSCGWLATDSAGRHGSLATKQDGTRVHAGHLRMQMRLALT